MVHFQLGYSQYDRGSSNLSFIEGCKFYCIVLIGSLSTTHVLHFQLGYTVFEKKTMLEVAVNLGDIAMNGLERERSDSEEQEENTGSLYRSRTFSGLLDLVDDEDSNTEGDEEDEEVFEEVLEERVEMKEEFQIKNVKQMHNKDITYPGLLITPGEQLVGSKCKASGQQRERWFAGNQRRTQKEAERCWVQCDRKVSCLNDQSSQNGMYTSVIHVLTVIIMSTIKQSLRGTNWAGMTEIYTILNS